MTLEPGVQIGSYRIDEVIGRGGMGVVYRATDTRLNRSVAIKFLSETLLDANARRRFQREAQMASALNHPHILTVHDVGDHEGAQYLVMELIDGGTLEEWLAAEPRTWRQCVEIMIGVADALAATHAANILHRDIKPGNILVSRSGHAKLVDFGLAKPEQSAAPTGAQSGALTRSGAIIGTVGYMSPEQIAGRTLDARSDVFAFGTVLYEMLAGRRPFGGATDLDVMVAVTKATPAPLPGEIPEALRTIVDKAIEKDPAERYQSMRDLVVDLKRVARKTGASAPTLVGASAAATGATVSGAARVSGAATSVDHVVPLVRRRGSRPLAAALVALVVVGLGAGYLAWNRSTQARWAREEAIPTIARLTDEGNYREAFELAEQARRYAGNDSLLRRLAPIFTATYTVTSTPSDASVYVRGYADAAEEWQLLGRTPLAEANVARRPLRWRIEKDGFERAELATAIEDGNLRSASIAVTLQPLGSQPDMVFVPGGAVAQAIGGTPVRAELGPFFIDRYEVTNAAYKEFVDAGGYERQSFWQGLDLAKDGAPLAWEEAMRLFVDATGRAGPATWELGDYPQGQAQYPVTGVSWYEATAYARFRGKSLPTVYHWSKAALPRNNVGGLPASIVPASNYAAAGPAAVGTYQGVGPYGTYDMHGNVSEWTSNYTGEGRAWTLGGSWQDAAYNFFAGVRVPPLERPSSVGFRLMHDAQAVPTALTDPVDLGRPPALVNPQPVSDDVYTAHARQFAYQPGELNAAGPDTVETTDAWQKQRVSVDTGYGERMDIFLFVPTRSRPPYQALVYFPPADAFSFKLSSDALQPGNPAAPLDFIVKSGRVFVHPIYQGTYERFAAPLALTDELALQRHWVDWRRDLGRTIDYLETRADIDTERIGYIGVSFGSIFPLHLPALESRLRAAVLLAGGLFSGPLPPSLDPAQYASRITMPVLMMNGRFDYIMPPEAQSALFDLLATPGTNKRRVIVDSGHIVPRSETLRESLAWLDEYLGPVR